MGVVETVEFIQGGSTGVKVGTAGGPGTIGGSDSLDLPFPFALESFLLVCGLVLGDLRRRGD